MAAWLIPVGIAAGSAVAKTPIRYLVKWITPTGKTATKSVVSKEAGIKVLGKKGFKPSDIKVETGKGVRAKGAEPKKTKSSGRWEKFRKHGSQVGGPEIIISGPGGPDNPKEMKTDLSNWGVSDQVISELRGDDLRKAHKAKRLEVKGRRGGGKVIYKSEGSKVINKKKKRKTGKVKVTAVDRKTGKKDPAETKRIKKATELFERTYPSEMTGMGLGLRSPIQRGVNDLIRQFVSDEDARTMRAARKVADHPRMQEKGLTGSRSKPLDAPRKHGGGMSRVGLSPAEEKHEGKSRSTGTLSEAKRKLYMNTGGKVGDKKQGYKARKDESISERVKKKRTPKELTASRDESYGKWGKGKGKGKINQTDGNKLVASLYD